MTSKASELFGRMKVTWGRINPVQRWLVVGMALALAAAVGVVYYLNRPDWVVLVSQADPKDAAAIVTKLQELKVPYQPSGDGYTILVPKAEQYTAKLALAQAGLPKGTGVGFEIFDEPKFGATDFDRRVNYLRAQQGELERALLRIADIEYVSVKLAIPEQSVFVRQQQPVKASVLVQPRTGRKLSADQVQGVVTFMASSVQGLTAENVSVVDQTGRVLNTTNGLSTDVSADQALRQDELQRKMENGVQTLLETMFGPGNVTARVSLELNMDASRIETTTVGGSAPKSTTVERESSKGQTSAAGTTATTPGAPPVYQGQTPAGTDDTWKTSTKTDYEVSNRKETTLVSPGAVKRISVGVAINRPDLTAEQIKQVRETVASATGADVGAISVTAMQFTRELPTDLASQTKTSAPLQPVSLAIGLGAAAAVLLVGFVMTRRRRGDEEELEVIGGLAAAPAPGTTLDVALGLSGQTGAQPGLDLTDNAALDAAVTAAAAEIGPEMVNVNPLDLKTAQQKLEFVMAAKGNRKVILGGEPIPEELMVVIDDLIDSHPETCAMILREWMKGGAGL